MNPVVHFELPFENLERAMRFYAEAFSWKTHALGPSMGDYVLLTTAESDIKRGTPAGAINGGMFPKTATGPLRTPAIVIAVDDIEDAMNAVRDAGGEVLGEPHLIPNYGRYVTFVDTEGNRNSMLQPSAMP